MIRPILRSLALSAAVLLAGCGDDSSTGPSASSAVTVTSGVPVTGISGTANSRKLYKIIVPPGSTRLLVETEGGSGDVDVLIRRNRVPTLLESDCESFEGTNDDGCDVINPGSGTWYILLFGAGDNGYTGATLRATVTTPVI
jgi:hypothetical protein